MNSKQIVRAAVALALLGSAPVVFAQTAVTQGVQNIGNIVNGSLNPDVNVPTIDASTVGLDFGSGASASVSATGAVGSVSVSAINSPLPAPLGGLGTIGQVVANTGTVTNGSAAQTASINLGTTSTTTAGALGLGASASVSATGAVGSVSISALNDNSTAFTGADLSGAFAAASPVTQSVSNGAAATVNNFGAISGATSLYSGASESVSATGAVASVSESFTAGAGAGALITTPVTGFTAALSAPSTVTQTVDNVATVQNFGSVDALNSTGAVPAGGDFTPGLGQGASVSVGATGAVASVSFSSLADSNAYNPGTVGATLPVTNTFISQGVSNEGFVSNVASIFTGDLTGNGASVSASATGAVGSFSISGNNVSFAGGNFGSVGQTVDESGSNVINTAAINVGNLSGAGASVSGGATGAVASVSYSNIGGSQSGLTVGPVTQQVSNVAIIDNGFNPNGTSAPVVINVNGAGVSGAGASVSASATGAVASVSSSSIANEFSGVPGGSQAYGAITQGVGNNGAVTNVATINAPGVDFSGDGASASISATGAVGSVSLSSVDSAFAAGSGGNYASVNQGSGTGAPTPTAGVVNNGLVSNSGTVNVGGLSGIGSSASVAATGSVASFSVSSVADLASIGAVSVPTITQTSYNNANITNAGNISVSGPGGFSPATLGVGASASVAATGAVASASFRAVH